MANILIIGAGRSATSLIDYLLNYSTDLEWKITIADVDKELAEQKAAGHVNAKAIGFDIKNTEARRSLIREHDFVISMLPATMHGDVARDCVEFGKHMATASYVSKEMQSLHDAAKEKNIILLNECGLDPGIDHASGMKLIDEITAKGGEIHSFKSYCGGLVAPESNNNPWGYKFSWNPRNVVLAGQGTAQYLEHGALKFIPYNRLFTQIEVVEIKGYGKFDAYANRDSISYIDAYGLKNIKTMLRGTLRQHGYCKAWDVFIRLGLTDDSSKISEADKLTYTSLLEAFLPQEQGSLKSRLAKFVGVQWDEEMESMMDYLGIFSDKKIQLHEGSPAQLLQHLLEEKWKLAAGDKDMIVLQHQFKYTLPESSDLEQLNSSLVVVGKDQHHTAMAQTVGLPLAICVKNVLLKKITLSGVQIPVKKEIYEPLLAELEELSIRFTEEKIQ